MNVLHFIRDKSRPSGFRPVETTATASENRNPPLTFIRDASRPSGYRAILPEAQKPTTKASAALDWLVTAVNASVRAVTGKPDPCPVRRRITQLEAERGGMKAFTFGDWLELSVIAGGMEASRKNIFRASEPDSDSRRVHRAFWQMLSEERGFPQPSTN